MIESLIMALIGGSIIGVAASTTLYFSGRISGISTIVDGLFDGHLSEIRWRAAFVTGLLVGGLILMFALPETIQAPKGRSLLTVSLSGLLVGFGTRLGSGCTSGHGVCGLSRLSLRSLVATLTFMLTGFTTATLLGWLSGAVQ